MPIPPDFHGGEENFRSVDYMAIPYPPMQTLATMIFDGVLERHPQLRVGVIEQGCIWLPSWIKQMESAMDAFGRHEERLRDLSFTPREFVERQVRVTPYPTEDIGWVTDQIGPDILLFNTDYPHVEGGRRPFERFEAQSRRSGRDDPRPLLRRQLRRPHGLRCRSPGVTSIRDDATVERELGDRNAWLALGVTTLVFFLVVIDVSAVNVAFPSIRDDFGVSEATLGWVISGYDDHRRRPLAGGRTLRRQLRPQAALPPGRRDLHRRLDAVRDLAERRVPDRGTRGPGRRWGDHPRRPRSQWSSPTSRPNKRSTVIGFIGATGSLGAVVGPALGAVLTDVWSWRGIFWINVPLAVIVLVAGPRLLRESKNPNATGKIDLVGVPIGTVGVGLVMLAIVRSESWGILDVRVLALATGRCGVDVAARATIASPERTAPRTRPLLAPLVREYQRRPRCVLDRRSRPDSSSTRCCSRSCGTSR